MENKTQSKDFPKRHRGRPKVFDISQTTMVQGVYPRLKTTRSLQARIYMLRTMNLLRNSTDCQWLWDRENHVIRQTILGELGRIDRDEDLLTMARQICESKPRARDAILTIRRSRLHKEKLEKRSESKQEKKEGQPTLQATKTEIPPVTEPKADPPISPEPDMQGEMNRQPEELPKQEVAHQVEAEGMIWDYFEPTPKI